jgi:hypothetical protein
LTPRGSAASFCPDLIRRTAAALAVLAFAGSAAAADITHVATAGRPEWPIEVDVTASFVGIQQTAIFGREQIVNGQGQVTLPDISYKRTTLLMPLRVAVGLWHGLELHVLLPIVIDDQQTWKSAPNTTSTVTTTPTVCPEGPTNAAGNCSNGSPPTPLVSPSQPLPLTSDRGSFTLGNLTVGLAWAIFDQEYDDTKPTWVLALDYTAPTAKGMNPTQVSYSPPGSPAQAVGDRFNHLTPWTAISRRLGLVEPYVEMFADIPIVGGGAYDNCPGSYTNNGGPRLNCGVGQWTTAVTRIQPTYSGGFWFGSEFVASENKEQRSKVVIDVRLTTVYFGPARTYTQISDLLQALTYQQDFLRVGAQVGLTLQASKTFLFHLRFGLAHDTDHWLTSESLGQPAAGSSTVDVGSTQQSPNFDFRYDNPGSRFLLQNSLIGSLGADVELRF